jgi:hypothetical protein
VRPIALWGVYHANGGLVGELAYVFGKIRGTAHCALCDITHGPFAKKPEWRALEAEIGIPIRLVHLNERPPELLAATGDRTPALVLESEEGWHEVMGPDDLEACGASVSAFRERLDAVLAEVARS